MDLINFVLHNWYLVIVLIFLLSSLRGRRKGAGTERPPKQAMPPFGGGGSGWGKAAAPTAASPEPPQPRPGQSKAARRQKEPPYRPMAEAGNATAAKRTDAARKEPVAPAGRRADETSPIYREPAAAKQERFDADKLAQGLVWSEILGPPRAKRPFRR